MKKSEHNRKKSKKGNKHYWGKHKLTRRETNFRIWLEREQHFPYSFYRSSSPSERAAWKQEWYQYLKEVGKSPIAQLPKKHRP